MKERQVSGRDDGYPCGRSVLMADDDAGYSVSGSRLCLQFIADVLMMSCSQSTQSVYQRLAPTSAPPTCRLYTGARGALVLLAPAPILPGIRCPSYQRCRGRFYGSSARRRRPTGRDREPVGGVRGRDWDEEARMMRRDRR